MLTKEGNIDSEIRIVKQKTKEKITIYFDQYAYSKQYWFTCTD